jgi:hypothetical protein
VCFYGCSEVWPGSGGVLHEVLGDEVVEPQAATVTHTLQQGPSGGMLHWPVRAAEQAMEQLGQCLLEGQKTVESFACSSSRVFE